MDLCASGTSRTESEPRRHMRVIAGAAPRLYELVHAAAFHEDLFYLLNIIHVSIPPLRERREDIPGLILRLLRSRALQGRLVTPDAMARLVAHGWPGNVRELERVLEDVARHRAVIRPQDLPQHVPSACMDARASSHAPRTHVPREIARVH
jgi:transcriptional regulator with PAS, ATPase and Fis domain